MYEEGWDWGKIKGMMNSRTLDMNAKIGLRAPIKKVVTSELSARIEVGVLQRMVEGKLVLGNEWRSWCVEKNLDERTEV